MTKVGSLFKLIIPHLKKTPTTFVPIEKFENPVVDIQVGGAYALALDSNFF